MHRPQADRRETIVRTIASISTLPEHRRKGMRYITLSNFWRVCRRDGHGALPAGVVKLLNSLSATPMSEDAHDRSG
jgi:hypothetical protein